MSYCDTFDISNVIICPALKVYYYYFMGCFKLRIYLKKKKIYTMCKLLLSKFVFSSKIGLIFHFRDYEFNSRIKFKIFIKKRR